MRQRKKLEANNETTQKNQNIAIQKRILRVKRCMKQTRKERRQLKKKKKKKRKTGCKT
jgi:hypothetical protein